MSSALSISKHDIKYISFQDIGFRNEEGPFFEFSLYMKEAGALHTFGDFNVTKKDDLGSLFQNAFGITPSQKTIAVQGWTWGELMIDQRVIAF